MTRFLIQLISRMTLASAVLILLALGLSRVFILVDNEIIYTVVYSNHSNIYRMDILHGLSNPLKNNTIAYDYQQEWSPDGEQIAFRHTDQKKGAIYLMDAQGKNMRQFMDKDQLDFNPIWSPDGKSIAYVTARYGDNTNQLELMLTDIESGETRRLTNNNDYEFNPNWSPDGQHIVFQAPSSTSDNINIFDLDVQTGQIVTLINKTDYNVNPAWSPDGKYLLYTTSKVSSRIFLRDSTSHLTPIITTKNIIVSGPNWSSDGRYIVYSTWVVLPNDKDYVGIYRLDVTTCLEQPKNCVPELLTPVNARYESPKWRPAQP